jgi:predicted adenylyl cyclase CyaB
MPSNIELKIKVSFIRKYESILKSLGLKRNSLLNQKDIYYEVKKGLLKLRIENGKCYFIRYLRDETSRNRISNYSIIEIKNDSPEKFFNSIFNVRAIVEKKRILYVYKNTRIHLDRIEKLGNFIELESVITRNKGSALKEFNEVVNLLNLDISRQIKKSYKDLIS